MLSSKEPQDEGAFTVLGGVSQKSGLLRQQQNLSSGECNESHPVYGFQLFIF